MRTRIICMLFSIALTASMVSTGSCAEKQGEESAAESEMVSDTEVASDTLEYIAKMNDCEVEDLICSYNNDGFVTFLGAAYTEEPIRDAADAEKSLKYLQDIAGLEGCEFVFYREDVSPVSGCTYYTFSQVSSPENEDMPITFSYSQIRVIVDQDGHSAGFSADIMNPNDLEAVATEAFVDQAEAEALVAGELTTGNVISEMTAQGYWDDLTEANAISETRVIPAWMIYSDEGRDGKPYTMYAVSATRNYDGEAVVCARVGASTLDVGIDTYTSEFFFEGMEDGGIYTYQLDMNWAFDADCGYEAEEVREVTVPVMYDSESGLYYMADYNERIVSANYYDFKNNTEVNVLVSEHPEEVDSWHFASMTGTEGEAYFCDPNYVIASYDAMLKTYKMFKDRYGYNSVDKSGMPILLLVYYSEDTYPEEQTEFPDNACNMGQWNDWAVFGTSPATGACVDVGVMAHEFSHGINGQLTNCQYLNEMGAVMEGYADSIGQNIAILYGYEDSAYTDYIGGLYSNIIRCFSNPYEFYHAKYIGGPYYASPVESDNSVELDYGGVHENSSVVNYLCYSLSHSDDNQANVIDTGNNLDMFLETLYCATYNSGYDELGAYLMFAAMHMDISEEELQYVFDTIYRLGFAGDGSELEQLIAEETVYRYSVKITGDEEDLEPWTFGALFYDENTGECFLPGGADSENEISMTMLESLNCYCNVVLMERESGEVVGLFFADGERPDEVVELPFSLYEMELGQTLDLDGTIYVMTFYDYETGIYTKVTEYPDEHSITMDTTGIYCITVNDDQGGYHFIFAGVREE